MNKLSKRGERKNKKSNHELCRHSLFAHFFPVHFCTSLCFLFLSSKPRKTSLCTSVSLDHCSPLLALPSIFRSALSYAYNSSLLLTHNILRRSPLRFSTKFGEEEQKRTKQSRDKAKGQKTAVNRALRRHCFLT